MLMNDDFSRRWIMRRDSLEKCLRAAEAELLQWGFQLESEQVAQARRRALLQWPEGEQPNPVAPDKTEDYPIG